jgi:hypothetical protein
VPDVAAVNYYRIFVILKNNDKLTPEEVRYVNYNSSVDFVVYYRLNKKPVLIIEIDGFAFHENNPEQLVRDALKDSALKKTNKLSPCPILVPVSCR